MIIIIIIIILIIVIIIIILIIIYNLNFICFLFLNKRIYIFSSILTAILSIVGHITQDVCISLHQFKSSGFFPFFITHTKFIAGRCYAYVYCSTHYKIQGFFR